jgi:hypothetical protein
LLANGKIYAGFGSFCDQGGRYSRGWVLGWDAVTLKPLGTSTLIDDQSPDQSPTAMLDCVLKNYDPCFLSSIWMSGYGLAADTAGNVYFTTGNTAGGAYSNDPKSQNLAESAVKLSSDLTKVLDFFTPNAIPASEAKSPLGPCAAGERCLDDRDLDFGSGGLLVLPDTPVTVPRFFPPVPPLHLAAAAGKDGRMFLLNRDNMGGFNPKGDGDFPTFVPIGDSGPESACLCGPSFFVGSGGFGRVVSSGGGGPGFMGQPHTEPHVMTWTINPNLGIRPALQLEASSATGSIAHWDQAGGFFTSISSNGRQNAIIWAVSRPLSKDDLDVRLYAFDARPSNGELVPLLPKGGIPAGSWPNVGLSTANIVPTVANGRVYVASALRNDNGPGPPDKGQLQIFGLGLTSPVTTSPFTPGFPSGPSPVAQGDSSGVSVPNYWGILKQVDGDLLLVELRTGHTLLVDITQAVKEQSATPVNIGQSVAVRGVMNADGIFEASTLWRVAGRSTWGEDSPPPPVPQ